MNSLSLIRIYKTNEYENNCILISMMLLYLELCTTLSNNISDFYTIYIDIFGNPV